MFVRLTNIRALRLRSTDWKSALSVTEKLLIAALKLSLLTLCENVVLLPFSVCFALFLGYIVLPFSIPAKVRHALFLAYNYFAAFP